MFEGKIALITGGSRGIGAAIAWELAQHGATALVNYKQGKDAAEEVCHRIADVNGKAFAIQADISLVCDIDRMFDEIEK
jgi:Dehydrogenases with different specificities (related to short-chain alcohol dehydrogenases)